MWLNVAKIVARTAVALGLHNRVKEWVLDKIRLADEQLEDKYESVGEKIDDLREEVENW